VSLLVPVSPVELVPLSDVSPFSVLELLSIEVGPEVAPLVLTDSLLACNKVTVKKHKAVKIILFIIILNKKSVHQKV
jgi:hypothetical protein